MKVWVGFQQIKLLRHIFIDFLLRHIFIDFLENKMADRKLGLG